MHLTASIAKLVEAQGQCIALSLESNVVIHPVLAIKQDNLSAKISSRALACPWWPPSRGGQGC